MQACQIFPTRITSLLSALVLLTVTAGNVCAAAAPAANTLTFTEAWSDKLGCASDMGDWYCGTASSDSITISAKISLTGVVTTNFTKSTMFDFSLGGCGVISHALGDDPKYKSGKKGSVSATFVDKDDASATAKPITIGTVKLSWTTKQLTVTITGKFDPNYGSLYAAITANTYEGAESGKISGDTISGSIDFADISVSFDSVTVTGTVKTKTAHAKDGNDYPLSTIALKGSGTGTRN